jgi:hypothetical protein
MLWRQGIAAEATPTVTFNGSREPTAPHKNGATSARGEEDDPNKIFIFQQFINLY